MQDSSERLPHIPNSLVYAFDFPTISRKPSGDERCPVPAGASPPTLHFAELAFHGVVGTAVPTAGSSARSA